MIINHNIASINANRMMGVNRGNTSKSMEKLSSGLKINRAGDNAAGLAISEKMRAQIRGLDQAVSNGQDGISMIQTAEGALSETHSILQRMRELAVQSANDTNVAVDRSEIQKEMDELAKEITRIANNTEFNTQKLINGGITDQGLGSARFHIGANANQDITLSINAMDARALGVSRDVNTATIDDATNTAGVNTVSVDTVDVENTLAAGDYQIRVTTVNAGNPTVTSNGAGTVNNGAAGGVATANTNIVLTYTAGAAATSGDAIVGTGAAGSITGAGGNLDLEIDGVAVSVALAAGDNAAAVAGKINAAAGATALGAGTYATVDGTGALVINSLTTGASSQVEVLTSSTGSVLTDLNLSVGAGAAGTAASVDTWVASGDFAGTLTVGNATAQNLANGLTVTTSNLTGFANGDTVTISAVMNDVTTVQLFDGAGAGANAIGDAVTINVARGGSYVIGNAATGQAKVNFRANEAVAGNATFTVATSVATSAARQADGTMSEAEVAGGLNVSTQPAASAAITTIQNAIEMVSAERSKLGAYQNRLEHTIANLGTSSENLTAAESRIRDVDMAKEMSNFSKNNILSQAAQSMLAQANQLPQQVLQLLQ
jgi:flagellin